MTQNNPEDLAKDLEKFSLRLEARIREFKVTGKLSSDHDAIANKIRKHQADLAAKVNQAIRAGTPWDVIGTEFARDYGSLSDSFLRWEERLDTDSMKNNKS